MATLLNRPKSRTITEKALKVIPGGVNSPVRSFRSVDIPPLIVDEGVGDVIVDVDGNRYIDFCNSWGALILGHAHKDVVDAAMMRLLKGSTFGITTPSEEKLASLLIKHYPSLEKVRFVSSGTEATMSAIRLARAYAKKDLIIKFEGHYHGHADHLLVKGGSGLIENTLSATSAGVPYDVIKNTLTLPFNDFEAISQLLRREKNIACVIVEPIAANMGVVPPKEGFLHHVRQECSKAKVVLIFDEVITGYRVGLKGAQGHFGIVPDLSTFGKIIGGGFPCAAFGGKKEIMDLVAPLGPVYQAGTLSGNPVAMEAGCATLNLIEQLHFYEQLESKCTYLLDPIEEWIKKKNLNVSLQRVGSMFTLFFGAQKVEHFQRLDEAAFRHFFCYLLEKGIYFSPSQYEANFLSSAHTIEHLTYVRDSILEYFRQT
jgi:glutamate-1-semialdehyde 2,1-aminomutase